MRKSLTYCTVTLAAVIALALGASEARAAGCRACDVALEQCLAGCAGLDAKAANRVACLLGCDNARAECSSCDERVSLRSEDLVNTKAIQDAALAACHSTTPCGSAYGSCAGWSSYFDCGSPFCGNVNGCGENCEPWPPLPFNAAEPDIPCPGPGLKQYRERYRVCFNQYGQSCTEYQRILTNLGCGC